jgi:hypothetical protein
MLLWKAIIRIMSIAIFPHSKVENVILKLWNYYGVGLYHV